MRQAGGDAISAYPDSMAGRDGPCVGSVVIMT